MMCCRPAEKQQRHVQVTIRENKVKMDGESKVKYQDISIWRGLWLDVRLPLFMPEKVVIFCPNRGSMPGTFSSVSLIKSAMVAKID